jgi:hypothetical protein
MSSFRSSDISINGGRGGGGGAGFRPTGAVDLAGARAGFATGFEAGFETGFLSSLRDRLFSSFLGPDDFPLPRAGWDGLMKGNFSGMGSSLF